MSVQVHAGNISKRLAMDAGTAGPPKRLKHVHFATALVQQRGPSWSSVFGKTEVARLIVSFLGVAAGSKHDQNRRKRLPTDPDLSETATVCDNSMLSLSLCSSWTAQNVPKWFTRIRIRLRWGAGDEMRVIEQGILEKILSRHNKFVYELRFVGTGTHKVLQSWAKNTTRYLSSSEKVPSVPWSKLQGFAHLERLGFAGNINVDYAAAGSGDKAVTGEVDQVVDVRQLLQVRCLELRYCTYGMLENYIVLLEQLKHRFHVNQIAVVGVRFDDNLVARLAKAQPAIESLSFRYFHVSDNNKPKLEGMHLMGGNPTSGHFMEGNPNSGYLSDIKPNCSEIAIQNQTPSSLNQFASLKELTWSRALPSSINDSLGHIKSLAKVHLNRNFLNSLPKKLFVNWTNVTELDLSENRLKSLPSEIGLLARLTKLKLSRNQIQELPSSIGQLSILKDLNVRSNALVKLPQELGNLHQLIRLRTDGNQLTEFPDTFGSLQSLEELGCAGNLLSSFPDSICEVTSLVSISAQANKLVELPAQIGNLKQLRQLFLQQNMLSSLPESFGNLQSLVWFGAASNRLTLLPESICRLSNLRVLNLQSNILERLPDNMGCLNSLDSLRLDSNQLRVLPNSCGKLTSLLVLTVNDNNLESLPRSIGGLLSLELLSLFRNKNLRPLPHALATLPHLKQLGIDHAGVAPVVFQKSFTK